MAKLQETKNTCQSCGNVWFFGKTDQIENIGSATSNLGKSLSCCTGCAPAAFLPNKKVIDLKRCPKCQSRNVQSEKVTHEIP